MAELGAAKSTLTAQVVYYDGTNYSTTKPSSVGSVVPKINGQNTYTDNYTLDLNGNITLTTTYTGDKLTFVGWSTTQNVTTTDNCSGVSAPSGMTHSGAHKIIKTDMSQPTITAIMDQGTKSGGTVALPIPTTIYAIYRVKQSAALTVKFAKSNGASTPTYTAWDGDADGDSTADAKYGVSPTSATTTGMFGGAAAHITASIDTTQYDYKFIGWMKSNAAGTAPTGALITTDGTTATAANLSSVSVGATGGMGAATFTMPTTPVATTIFAVYEPIPTQTITVKKDAGIQSVTVKRTRGGTTSTLTLGAGTTASGITTYPAITVRSTDTITVTSTAATNYTVNGFDVTGNCTYTGSSNSVTLVLDQNANVTVLAKSKLAPPELTLTATDGAGTLEGTTLTNTTSPSVDVTNNGPSKAVIKSVTKSGADADHFTMPNDPTKLGNATAELAASGTGSLTFVPDTSKTWAVGNYFFNVTITYTNPDYLDADGNEIEYTETVAVKYVVSENEEYTGKVTVKLDGAAAYVNGNASKTASIKLTPDGGTQEANGTAVNASGERSIANLDKAQSIEVTYGGKTYTISEQLSKSNPEVTVDLYTVTINLAHNATETAALTKASGSSTTPTVTLKVTGATDKAVIGTSAHPAGWTLSSVLLKDSSVTINAATSNLNTGYSFDKWDSGKSAADGNLSGSNAVTLSDISSASHTFTVAGTTTYTAHLKQENYKVLTFDDDRAHAPHIKANPDPATNMPSSQVTAGSSVTIPNVTPILPGYEFVGWITTANKTAAQWTTIYGGANHTNGTDTAYKPGESVAMTADKTLYAVWKDASITIGTVPTVPDGVYGSSYTFDLAGSMTVAPSGVALTYSATSLPAGLSVNATTGSVTGYPRTTGKDNAAGTALETGFPARAFTPTFTATLANDYHDTGYEVKAVLVADGVATAVATTNNTKTYHTAAKDKLAVDKAATKITGIAISNVTAGGALSDATFTVSVTGPRYVGGSGSGWNFAYTATLEYTKDGKSAGTNNAGSATFSSDGTGGNTFKAEGDTVVTASFTPEAQDVNGNTSGDAFTSFDAFDADHHKNLQSHVWKAPEDKTQKVTPGVSTGEMKVKLALPNQ